MPTVPGVTGQNPYDSLLDQQEAQQPQVVADDYLGAGFRTSDLPQAPGVVVNPYDKILDESIRRSETLARMTALDTSGKDPEQYAEYLRLGQEIGLPVQAVENDPEQAKQIQRLNQWGKMAQESPQVAAWLAIADNGVLAQDDLEALSGMEKLLRGVGDTATSLPAGVNTWLGRGISGFGDLYDAATVSLAGGLRAAGVPESVVGSDGFTPTQPGQDGWWMNPANWFRAAGDPITELGESAVPEERQNFATDVAGGVGQLIGQVVATRINPFVPLTMNASVGAEGQASRAEEAGATPEETARAVALGATITAAVEKIGLDLLLERLPPAIQNRAASWIVDKALAGGIEGGQEAVEQIANNLVAQMVYDPNAAIFEGVGESASVGAAVGVIARTIFGVRMRDDHRNVAKSEQTTVDSLVDLASQSNLRQRAPEKFRDLMARLSGDQSANYHVDAQEFNKLYQSKGLNPETVAAEMGVDIDAYRIATLSDGEIAIPLSSYVTKVDKADHAVLSEFGKLTPGGLTPAEAAMDDETVARQADLMRAGIQAELAGDNRIRDDVTGMLVERYGQETAEKYGTLMQAWFRTMGERSGVDGFDLYSRYRLRIKNELPGLKSARPVDTILDPLIERLRTGDIPTEGQARGPTLAEFLSERGGIMDEAMSGEIRSIAESDRATRRGQRKLVRPDAKFTLDGALEAAVESGYLPEGAEINDLLEALTGELVTDRPTYAAANENTRALNDRMSLLALDEELGRRGIDVSKATNEEIRRALSDEAAINVAALYNQIGSPGSENFRTWFRDSKVVGPNGRPMVVYHGTGEEFNAFDKLRLSQGTGHASSGLGFYFTPSRRSAEGYAEKASNGVPADAVVLEVYLSIQNPYEMTLEEASEFQDPAHSTAVRWMLQSQGYDGVWIPEQNAWVAFEPTQIKSVNNRGTYSLVNPNIYHQSVWHGSPHRGIEQTGFSLQKIGTGEGAQAFGWGLYFAGRREIAEFYRTTLSRQQFPDGDPRNGIAHILAAKGDDAEAFIRRTYANYGDQLDGMIEDARKANAERGQLYAAEIPDDGDLLDWDAPLSEQPEKVKAAIGALGFGVEKNPDPFRRDESWLLMFDGNSIDAFPTKKAATAALNALTGQQLYQKLATSRGQRGTSEFLFSLGIPGLRYLDGTSRGAGDGSRNYVIWDEGAISDVRTFYQSDVQPDPRLAGTKVVDESGKPLTLYHGSNEPLGRVLSADEFMRQFEEDARKSGLPAREIDSMRRAAQKTAGAMWFTNSESVAYGYAGQREGAEVVTPVRLNMRNPLDLREMEIGDIESILTEAMGDSVEISFAYGRDKGIAQAVVRDNGALIQWAKANGYDGLIYPDTDVRARGVHTSYVTFSPEQIVPVDEGRPAAFNQSSQQRTPAEAFRGFTREQFLGKPKILPASNSSQLEPKALTTVRDADPEPFLDKYQARYSEDGVAVYDGDKVIASYNFGDTLVVDKKYRRQGIAEEMVYQWRTRNPNAKPATSRTKASQALQEKVWERIQRELRASRQPAAFNQAPGAEPEARGAFGWRPDGGVTITLSAKADASTFIHESAHFFLEVMGDLVQQPDASPQVAEDFRTLLTWAGTDPDQWFNMSIDQRRDAHERVARGFEAYVREGKAPSAELAGPFERFRGWLLAIYRSIRQLNVELSDDVRGVFDRMLATDAEIQRTEASNDYTPLFREAAAAGMTEAQFQSYVDLMGEASREARDALAATAVRDVYREREAWWKEEAEGVRKEVEAEVNQSPLYRAWYYLAFGTQPDGSPLPEGTDRVKLDRDWLIAQYGHEWVKKNLLRKRVYSVDGGGDPDLIAAAFGFESGDAMIQALANAEPRKSYVNAEVARRMRERHGDIMTDAGALEEAAQKAAHNSKRLQALDAEIATLARLVGEPKGTSSQIRRVAESMVARMKLRDINPNSYLRAERKNAKLAQQHAAKGQWAKALEAKRKQALNAHLYDVTLKAKEEGEKIRDYVKRFEKVKLRERLGKVGRLNEVDALLDAYDLRHVSGREIDRRKAQAQLVKAIDSGLLIAPRAVVERMRLDGSRTNYRELTMENLRGLRDVLRQMEKEARNEYEALLYGEKIDLDQKAEEIAAAIVANNKAIEPQLGQEAPAEAVRRYGKQALNAWLRPAAIARLLDGSDNGPMTRLIIQPIRDAVARVLEPMKVKAAEDLAALYSKHYTTKEMAAMNERTVVPGLNMSLSRWDVISIALNWGNADNREALIRSTVAGRQPFTQAGIEQALSTLTARDWAFVQESWDYLDSYWPQIKAAQERRRGIAPPKVDALPFTMQTADGRTVTLRGGYHPLRYNADLDARARQHEIDMTFEQMRAGTMSAVQSKYGHNQERVGSGGQPVMLSMNVMHQHVNNVIQDIALGDVVMMVDRLLKRQQVRDALVTTGNMDVLETMKLWLKDVATGELAARNGAEKTTQFLRRNFTLSKIGFNVMTAILGVTGVAQTQAVVGSRWMLEGAKDYTKNPKQAIAQVMDQSDFMRLRYEIGAFNKDVADFRQAMRTGAPISKSGGVLNGLIVAFQKSQMPPAFADAAFWMIRSLQMQVDTATWLAGYHKAKGKNMPHAEAVRYADGIVENAQTSGLFSDRGGFERGTFSETTRQSEFVKIWTTLGSYMIAKGNIAFESYKRTDFRNPAQVAGFMGDIGLLFFVEMLLVAAIRGSWPEEEEDWWWWATRTGGEQMLATIPIVREIPSFIKGFGGGGGPLGATMNDIAKVAQQTSQAEVDAALIKAYVNMIGTLTGAPSAQTNRAIDAAWREHVEGEDVNSIEYVLGKRQPAQ